LFFFFFNDTAPTETSPLSLPDALPIYFAVSEPFLSAMSCAKLPSNTISPPRSEEHTSELQSRENLVCRLLLEKKRTHIQQMCHGVLPFKHMCSVQCSVQLSLFPMSIIFFLKLKGNSGFHLPCPPDAFSN